MINEKTVPASAEVPADADLIEAASNAANVVARLGPHREPAALTVTVDVNDLAEILDDHQLWMLGQPADEIDQGAHWRLSHALDPDDPDWADPPARTATGEASAPSPQAATDPHDASSGGIVLPGGQTIPWDKTQYPADMRPGDLGAGDTRAEDLRDRIAEVTRAHYLADTTDADGHSRCACGQWADGGTVDGKDWDEHLADVVARDVVRPVLDERDREIARRRTELAEAEAAIGDYHRNAERAERERDEARGKVQALDEELRATTRRALAAERERDARMETNQQAVYWRQRAEQAECERGEQRNRADNLTALIQGLTSERDEHAALADENGTYAHELRQRAEAAEQARDRHAHNRDQARTELAYWRQRAETAEQQYNELADIYAEFRKTATAVQQRTETAERERDRYRLAWESARAGRREARAQAERLVRNLERVEDEWGSDARQRDEALAANARARNVLDFANLQADKMLIARDAATAAGDRHKARRLERAASEVRGLARNVLAALDQPTEPDGGK